MFSLKMILYEFPLHLNGNLEFRSCMGILRIFWIGWRKGQVLPFAHFHTVEQKWKEILMFLTLGEGWHLAIFSRIYSGVIGEKGKRDWRVLTTLIRVSGPISPRALQEDMYFLCIWSLFPNWEEWKTIKIQEALQEPRHTYLFLSKGLKRLSTCLVED